jgi:hypothetical protein
MKCAATMKTDHNRQSLLPGDCRKFPDSKARREICPESFRCGPSRKARRARKNALAPHGASLSFAGAYLELNWKFPVNFQLSQPTPNHATHSR